MDVSRGMSHIAELLAPDIALMLAEKRTREVQAALAELLEPEVADVLMGLEPDQRAVAFRLLPRERAADVFTFLNLEEQEELLSRLNTDQLAQLFNEMDPDDRAELFEELPGQIAAKLLALMKPEERRATQIILGYPPESVGRLMTPDYVALQSQWTVNPYRGCEHGCIYCFARPYHEYLGFSCGLDFETKIVAKMEAAQLLRRELARPSWKGEPIVMSAITDIYQPIEKNLRIARGCLELMAACAQPVTTMTKSALVLRDVDLWSKMSAMNTGRVVVTLVTLDAELARHLEPRAAAPSRRLHMIRELVKAGVSVSVNIAPVIPGLTDKEMPQIMQAIAEAGARRVAWVMLRLPYQLKDLFLDWLKRYNPERAGHVESLLRQSFAGKLYRADHQHRRRGEGEFAGQIARVFDVFTRKYGLNRDVRPLSRAAFRPPPADSSQMTLF